MAAACARVAVARFVDKAQGKLEAKGPKGPEAVRRNETKVRRAVVIEAATEVTT